MIDMIKTDWNAVYSQERLSSIIIIIFKASTQSFFLLKPELVIRAKHLYEVNGFRWSSALCLFNCLFVWKNDFRCTKVLYYQHSRSIAPPFIKVWYHLLIVHTTCPTLHISRSTLCLLICCGAFHRGDLSWVIFAYFDICWINWLWPSTSLDKLFSHGVSPIMSWSTVDMCVCGYQRDNDTNE